LFCYGSSDDVVANYVALGGNDCFDVCIVVVVVSLIVVVVVVISVIVIAVVVVLLRKFRLCGCKLHRTWR
jgi:hypothetical protein